LNGQAQNVPFFGSDPLLEVSGDRGHFISMENEPRAWQNFSPGDLSFAFPESASANVAECVARSVAAFPQWAARSLDERRDILAGCQARLALAAETLALLISSETGKPLRESRLEMAAVVAKFDLTFSDGEKYLRDVVVGEGPNPALICQRPCGPAAVIAPFNVPVHLGHGAALAYLLAGNTVLFKPSPLAVNVGLAYARIMQEVLPADVFQLVPGWGETGRKLCLDEAVRAVCFTGSVPVGLDLARSLAADTSKSLALELGGKNSLIVLPDADLDLAAAAAADGMCLTAGQRCNATSRVLVHRQVADAFVERLMCSLTRYQPGDPLNENTLLGPLISFAAHERYERLISKRLGDWVVPGGILEKVEPERHGYYVLPAVLIAGDLAALDESPLAMAETFAPLLVVEIFDDVETAISRHEAWKFGLTASVFTSDASQFSRVGSKLSVGNLYHNLPTTFSPSTLPFGGWGHSGNGHPGGRGFVRFTVQEQAIQWKI
jgi:acyl-CoA reductase-like NAD-dependent aldehyde dehydrogenase